MATENEGANSPAPEKTGEATATAAENITMGQASALLFANVAKEAKKSQTHQAAEDVSEENAATEAATEEPAETSAAETQGASESAEAEATKGAETTETPEETEEAAETVHSQKISFTPEQQELFNKRIQRETAKTKAIESQMAEARAKLTQLEAEANTLKAERQAAADTAKTPTQVVSFGNQPLAHITDIPTLVKLNQSAKEAIRTVEGILDDPRAWKVKVETDPDTGIESSVKLTKMGDQFYTEADLKSMMRRARITLEDQIPERANFLNLQNQEQQKAFVKFPFLRDKTSPDYQVAQAARRDYPWLGALPNADEIIGYQIMGRKAMEAQEAAATAAANGKAPKAKVAPAKPANDQAAVSASGAAPRAAIGSAERNALAQERARLSKKGGITGSDAAALLLKSQQIRNSR